MSLEKMLKNTIKPILQAAILCLPILPSAVLSHEKTSGMGTNADGSMNKSTKMDMKMKDDGHPMHMQMHSMPDAPLGIMGHHIHKVGGLMMSYQ